MLIKICLIVCTIITICSVLSDAQRQARKQRQPLPPCHWNSLDDCSKPLFYFSHRPNTTGLPLNRREHALLCRSIKNVTTCTEEFFNRCGTQFSQEMFVLVNEVYVNNVKTFCRNGDAKNNYLEHARCLNKVRLSIPFKRKCVSRFQATLESMGEKEDYIDRVGIACCGYKVWQQCSESMVAEQCSPADDAVRANSEFGDALTGGVPAYVCRSKKYDVDSKYCNKVLPTVRRRPKGRNSDNVFSKYFSLYYPNIGF